MEFEQIRQLAMAATHNTPLTFSLKDGETKTYDIETMNDALRKEFNKIAGNYKLFRSHKNEVFELIEDTIDEVLPRRVMDQYQQFADVKTVGQGDQAIFSIRITEAARMRAKAFVTRVGLAGRYETMILDGKQLSVSTSAIGHAIRIGFEEFLDGRYSFADFTNIMMEGMDDYIYNEIATALLKATTTLPAVNVSSNASFDEAKMDGLLTIADSYGNGNAAIYCTREFASTMKPANATWASDEMKNRLWRDGYFTDYKGHPVIILRQSMTDATNAEKVIDPANAFILPSVGQKPVKIAFEGATCVRTADDNDDWSTDLQTYKKFGVAILTNPSICLYSNTSLKKKTA